MFRLFFCVLRRGYPLLPRTVHVHVLEMTESARRRTWWWWWWRSGARGDFFREKNVCVHLLLSRSLSHTNAHTLSLLLSLTPLSLSLSHTHKRTHTLSLLLSLTPLSLSLSYTYTQTHTHTLSLSLLLSLTLLCPSLFHSLSFSLSHNTNVSNQRAEAET